MSYDPRFSRRLEAMPGRHRPARFPVKVEGEATEVEQTFETRTLIGQLSPTLAAELLGDQPSPGTPYGYLHQFKEPVDMEVLRDAVPCASHPTHQSSA